MLLFLLLGFLDKYIIELFDCMVYEIRCRVKTNYSEPGRFRFAIGLLNFLITCVLEHLALNQ